MIVLRKIIVGTATILLLIVAFCYWKIYQFADSPLTIKQETLLTLPMGSGHGILKEQLRGESIVSNRLWFSLLLRVEPKLAQFKAGTYRLHPGMTIKDMLLLLASGKEAQFSIRFVEGSRLQEWLAQIRTAPYIKHTLSDANISTLMQALKLNNGDDIEGWFYPDTYLYTANTSDIALLERAYQRMVNLVDSLWQQKQNDLPYKTVNDLVTMASIIEKETAVNTERGKIASVFINRLSKNMRLQSDPTVIYGMGEHYSGNLTRKDLQTPTLYNTYVINGLPPSPIAIPGKDSLEAATHPLKTDDLYFVSDGMGGHTFSANLADHNRAVQLYLKTLKKKNEK